MEMEMWEGGLLGVMQREKPSSGIMIDLSQT